jgi:hypothetical protein
VSVAANRCRRLPIYVLYWRYGARSINDCVEKCLPAAPLTVSAIARNLAPSVLGSVITGGVSGVVGGVTKGVGGLTGGLGLGPKKPSSTSGTGGTSGAAGGSHAAA